MSNPQYDARRKPKRGVRVRPLPRHCHRRFRGLCADLRKYCQSHYSTWRLAAGMHEEHHIQANAIYWRSCLRFINTLEYLGTSNDHNRKSSGSVRTDG